MKKILFLALAVMASASFTTVSAGKKDKKSKKEEVVVEAPAPAPVVLNTSCDSISYAAGYQQTNGLIEFLLQQKMDTAYMADFIRGLKEANSQSENPSFIAYSLGLNIASQLNDRMIPGLGNEIKEGKDSLNKDMFYEGFYASLANNTSHYTQESAGEYFRTRMKEISDIKEAKAKAEAEKAKKAGNDWLAENAKKEGVVTLPSGLQYKVLVAGTGVKPTSTEEVTVKYEGKLIDGTIFDSSYQRKEQTNKFKANQVIKGWTEALTMMPVGSTWELYIPENLAYGERAAGKIPAYSALIFKVELIDCESAHATPAKEVKATKSAAAGKTPTGAMKKVTKK